MDRPRPLTVAAFAAVVTIYVAVRLWGLTASCLWFDEIFSVHAAEHDWQSLWQFVALDLIHPPLFYALLKTWIAIGGESLMWLRLLPVLFAIAAVFPFIKFCVELNVPFWSRIVAVLLLAVNGSVIKYSQELRMYSLLMCLSLFSMWLFARYFQKGKGVIALTVINVLLVWTHYFAWFVVASELVAILIFQRVKWWRTASMFGVALASFVPWMIAVAMASSAGSGLSQNIGWLARPGIAAIVQLKLALIEPFYYQASSADPISFYKVSVPLLLMASIGLIWYLLRWRNQPADERRAFELAALFAATAFVGTFLLSWLMPYSVWGTRHLIIIFAPASVMISLAIARLPVAALRVSFVVIIVLFSGYAATLKAIDPAPQYIWCAWEQLINGMEPDKPARIYAAEDAVAYHLWFAARQNPDLKISKLEMGTAEDKGYFLPRGFNGVDRVGLGDLEDKDIWLAYRSLDGALPAAIASLGFAPHDFQMVKVQNTHAVLVHLQKE